MLVIVCYDIANVEKAGGKRLRKVAEACLSFGVRVQYSVFECRLSDAQWVDLRSRLLRTFESQEDSFRFYFLCERDDAKVEQHGVVRHVDPTGPLVL